MTKTFPILKDENNERPIPTLWRATFVGIVEALKNGDFQLEHTAACVQALSTEEATRISGNIICYGQQLTNLPEETWQTSVCRWMQDYWEVLIDLFTVEEGASDLVLFARVYQERDSYRFEMQSVHVP